MRHEHLAAVRLQRQHLTQPDFRTPVDVARAFGAVQAQDLYSSLYAIGLRMADATEGAVEQAITDKTIVRTWPMRNTIHFIPAEDTRWMLKLLAERLLTKNASIYRNTGLTEQDFARARDVLIESLQGGRHQTRPQLYASLEAAGIETSGEQRGLHILGYWSRAGLVCLGPRHGKQPTYVLLDEWLPPTPMLEGEEALATLARRYFASHGPATERDFAWWSGLSMGECRLGMRQVAQEFEQATIDGAVYWLSPGAMPAEDEALHSVHLLPPWDEFTVAYRDRSALVHPAFPKDSFIVLGPVIVVGGRLLGSWKRNITKSGVTVTCTLYAPLSADEREALEQAVARYGRFLGLPARFEAARR
ncbi:MAG TPA: winged helix DNA-binding domain-containing protein [Ktedonobacterales bacterium]